MMGRDNAARNLTNIELTVRRSVTYLSLLLPLRLASVGLPLPSVDWPTIVQTQNLSIKTCGTEGI